MYENEFLSETDVFSLIFNKNNAPFFKDFLDKDNFPNKCKEFIDQYPQHIDLLFNFLLMNFDTILIKSIKSPYYLVILLQTFNTTVQQEGMLSRVIAGNELFQAFDFIQIVNAAPAFKERLFTRVMEDDELIRQVFKTSWDLEQMLEAFNAPEQHEGMFASNELFQSCFNSTHDFKIIANAAPAFKERLFTRLMEDDELIRQIFKSSWDLEEMLIAFDAPEQQEGILSKVFASNELFQDCLEDAQDFAQIANAAPAFKEQLFTRLIEDDELIRQVFKSSWALEQLLKAFNAPEQHKGMLSKVFASNELLQGCLKDDNDFARIEKVVPDIKEQQLMHNNSRDKGKRKISQLEFFQAAVDLPEDEIAPGPTQYV